MSAGLLEKAELDSTIDELKRYYSEEGRSEKVIESLRGELKEAQRHTTGYEKFFIKNYGAMPGGATSSFESIGLFLLGKVILPIFDIAAVAVASTVVAFTLIVTNQNSAMIENLYKKISGIFHRKFSLPLDIYRLDKNSAQWGVLEEEWMSKLQDLQDKDISAGEKKEILEKIKYIRRKLNTIREEKERVKQGLKDYPISYLASLPMNLFGAGSKNSTHRQLKSNTMGQHIKGYFQSIGNLGASLFGRGETEEKKGEKDEVKKRIEKKIAVAREKYPNQTKSEINKKALIEFMSDYEQKTLAAQDSDRNGLTPAELYEVVYQRIFDFGLEGDKTLVRDAHKFLLQERRESIDLMILLPISLVLRPFILLSTLAMEPLKARYYRQVVKEGYQADFQGLYRIVTACGGLALTVSDWVYDTFLSRIFRKFGRILRAGRKKLNLSALREDKDATIDFVRLAEDSSAVYSKLDNPFLKESLAQKIIEKIEKLEAGVQIGVKPEQQKLIELYSGVVKISSVFENLINTKVTNDNSKAIVRELEFACKAIRDPLDNAHMDDSLQVLDEIERIIVKIKAAKSPEEIEQLLSSNMVNGLCLKDVYQGFLSKLTFETGLFSQKTKSTIGAIGSLFVDMDPFQKELVECTKLVKDYKGRFIDPYNKKSFSGLSDLNSELSSDDKPKSIEAKKWSSSRLFLMRLRKLCTSPTFATSLGNFAKMSSRVTHENDDFAARVQEIASQQSEKSTISDLFSAEKLKKYSDNKTRALITQTINRTYLSVINNSDADAKRNAIDYAEKIGLIYERIYKSGDKEQEVKFNDLLEQIYKDPQLEISKALCEIQIADMRLCISKQENTQELVDKVDEIRDVVVLMERNNLDLGPAHTIVDNLSNTLNSEDAIEALQLEVSKALCKIQIADMRSYISKHGNTQALVDKLDKIEGVVDVAIQGKDRYAALIAASSDATEKIVGRVINPETAFPIVTNLFKTLNSNNSVVNTQLEISKALVEFHKDRLNEIHKHIKDNPELTQEFKSLREQIISAPDDPTHIATCSLILEELDTRLDSYQAKPEKMREAFKIARTKILRLTLHNKFDQIHEDINKKNKSELKLSHEELSNSLRLELREHATNTSDLETLDKLHKDVSDLLVNTKKSNNAIECVEKILRFTLHNKIDQIHEDIKKKQPTADDEELSNSLSLKLREHATDTTDLNTLDKLHTDVSELLKRTQKSDNAKECVEALQTVHNQAGLGSQK